MNRSAATRSAAFVWLVLDLLTSSPRAWAQSHAALQLAVGPHTGTISLVTDGSDRWIITAYHNFAGYSSDGEARAAARVMKNAGADPVPFGDLVENRPLCVLPALGVLAARVSQQGASKLSTLGALFAPWKTPAVGDAIVAFGNPTVRILTKESYPFGEAASGTINMLLTAGAALPKEALAGDAPSTRLAVISGLSITHGFSGGPIFLQGHVDQGFLGMVQGGDNGTTSWAVPSDVIHAALADPGKCKPMGTSDGFTDLHYARTPDVLFDVSSVAPSPLEASPNTDGVVQVVVQMPGGGTALGNDALHFVPDVDAVPGLTFVRGLERVTPQNGEATFSVTLRFDDRAASEASVVPFSVQLHGHELGRFTIRVEHAVMRLRGGLVVYAATPLSGVEPPRGVRPFDGGALLDFGLDFRLGDMTTAALMMGVGPSFMYENHRVLDPRAAIVLASNPAHTEWGPRLQITGEMRFLDDRPVGIRAALGASWERHTFDVPPSAEPSVDYRQFSALFELGPTFRVNCFQFWGSAVGQYRAPSTADSRYVSLVTQEAVARSTEWALSLSGGVAHDF